MEQMRTKYPVVDLHCDLLLYLNSGQERTCNDVQARCSLPLLNYGGVRTQVLAIFSPTEKGSTLSGKQQWSHFLQLQTLSDAPVFLAAIENASCFCEEDEPLDRFFERIEQMQTCGVPIAYISLTWNEENRFGGGAHAPGVGLKPDGAAILEFLASRSIPVDFSHASDALAEDILRVIDQKRLALPILASHSNARAICPQPRNLPDAIAREIIDRNGIIGLNFIMHFIGDSPDALMDHYDHFLSLGGENAICFGADFFYPEDLPASLKKQHSAWFFEELFNSSCYPNLLEKWKAMYGLNENALSQLAHGNAERFLIAHAATVPYTI